MAKSINYLRITFEGIVILILSKIIFRLLFIPFENLINHSSLLWLIYDQLPHLIVISYVFLKMNELIRFSSFKIEKRKWYRYLLFLIIVLGIVYISYSIVSQMKTTNILFQLDTFNNISKNISILFYIKILILAPFFEEFTFRGIILNGFLSRYSPLRSIFITSLIFAVLHLNPMQFIATFLMGLLTGWYYYKTRNLLSCMIIHFLNNLIGIIVIKSFIDKLHYQVITSDTKLIQIDNFWLIIFLSLILIIVGFYYLIISVMDYSENQKLSK